MVVCSFYSPPDKGKNARLADYMVSTLHYLVTLYPDCAIFIRGDKNTMDLTPILNCGLKLRQIVDKPTRGGKIIDVLITNLQSLYATPTIAPPIRADNPRTGQSSDHSVPVCTPHTDRFQRPSRNYKTVKFRPLPDSGIRSFGDWIVHENWEAIEKENTVLDQVRIFENLIINNLNKSCPLKECKLSTNDKPFITIELKKIARKKSREYQKRGKTEKYKKLKQMFDSKYKKEATKYL